MQPPHGSQLPMTMRLVDVSLWEQSPIPGPFQYRGRAG